MTNSKLKYDFFICSTVKDSALVEDVLYNLSGFSVFYPNRDMAQQSGEMYFDVIAEALENSRDFIMIISPEAVKSKWVKIEYQTFFNNFYSVDNNRRIFLLKGKDFNFNDVPLFFRNFLISENVEQIIKKVTSQIAIPLPNKHSSELRENEEIPNPARRKNTLRSIIYIAIIVIILANGIIFSDHYREPVLSFIRAAYDKIAFVNREPDNASLMPKYFSGDFTDNQNQADENSENHVYFENDQFVLNDYTENEIMVQERQTAMHPKAYIEDISDARVINFPNGNRYEGELKDGIMHGRGMYYYAVRSLISKNDPLERYADAKSYILGEWFNGELYMGQLYDQSGELRDQIIIGRK